MADPKFHELMKAARRELMRVRAASEDSKEASKRAAFHYRRSRYGLASESGTHEIARREWLEESDRMRAKGLQSLQRARDLRAEAHKLLGGKK